MKTLHHPAVRLFTISRNQREHKLTNSLQEGPLPIPAERPDFPGAGVGGVLPSREENERLGGVIEGPAKMAEKGEGFFFCHSFELYGVL